MALMKENPAEIKTAAEELWREKTAEMNGFLQKIRPDLVGHPDFFPECILKESVVEKIFNSNFELDWIPKGLRLIDLRKDLKNDSRLFYQAVIIGSQKTRPDGALALSGDSGIASAEFPEPFLKNDSGGGYEHYAPFYWWGAQKFASEKVGGYWVLWLPEIYCLNQPARIQKGPCEVFAKECFNLAESRGELPQIAELVYLLLLHNHRAPDYAGDADFIGNFIRSGTPVSDKDDLGPHSYQNNLLVSAGWKLSRISEAADIKLMLHIDEFPFFAAEKNVGVVPFVKLKNTP